ncbi:GNAT family N-acetyltransferase [Paenarthrobacter ilicis]|uniref:GNAT superfamily N-acetyltransferase n=1 Tax=Paenarthrobacter ilicis TaxID=43665 RepID=A0ABX0TJZ2_9MICC|nr:GNAT family N-acetyltransferase [Paenarthrobacter ilicis]MBM7792694.1 GNAT superfamily N-acetyltransferase [Paenarthrobacter ilicis]NIJ01037.1 GNAT superfamily N-acetyltransferase [Paenarthrobacter ilicis]
MALEYREWKDGDDLALLEIWGGPETLPAEQFRAALASSSNQPWRRCIVAEDVVDGVHIPVAAAVVHEASLHPERLWAYIEVAKDHRRAGVGATLLAMLRREAANSPSGVSRLRSKVEPGTAGAAFAATAGLAPIQRSQLVVVEPEPLKLPRFGDGSEEAAAERVEDLATGSVELSEVVGKYYSHVHHWDSPGELGIATVQRLFLNDLTGAHGAIVLRAPKASAFGDNVPASRKGKIQAFAISYAQGGTDEPSDVFLGHDPDLSEADAAFAVRDLLALIAYQHPVLLEVDESMVALSAVLEPLLETGKAHTRGADTVIVSD